MRALGLSLLVLVAGCETYAETVSCGMGLVLDENDECVAPPAPDGSVPIASCAELCELVPAWSDEQRACLRENLAATGMLPASCTDLTSGDACLACVGEAAAPDAACAAAPALCPP